MNEIYSIKIMDELTNEENFFRSIVKITFVDESGNSILRAILTKGPFTTTYG
jgi:hypothetical protein